jgi:nucleoside-diphosphate-sugar epimerase
MRTLVTGATGFIGYEVARLLAERGLRPRLLVRRPERGLLLRRLDAELIHGNLESPVSLERAVTGVDAIIHLGARATFEEYRLLRPTIVDASEALIEAAAGAGVRHFVYGSSLFVYDDQPDPIDGATAPRPRLAYGRAKLEAERRLSAVAARSGMQLALLRLPHVYGARDLFFSKISRGRVIIPGRRENLFSHLHVHDCARVLIAAAEKGIHGCWPIADRRATQWEEFFEIVRDHYPRFRYLRLPESIALLGARLLRPFQLIRGKPTILTAGSVVGWNLNLEVRPRVLWEDVGLEPRYPTVENGIPAVLDDCVAFRWLHPVDDGCEG